MTKDLSRRTLIGAGIAAVGTAAVVGVETPAIAADVLPGFPSGITVRREVYKNWDGVVSTDPLWTCVPRNQAQVLAVVNWAHAAGYTVRARGYRHSWSPVTVEPGTRKTARVILVDTTAHLTAMSIPRAGRLRVEAGARMDAVLGYLNANGYSIAATPAPGDVTVGGVLAVNAHGTGVLAAGESPEANQNMGTMSNLVVTLTAAVWDAGRGEYRAKRFERNDPDIAPFLAHLGRAFVLEVTLQVMPAYSLRCRNYTDIPTRELFASPRVAGDRSLSALLDSAGRVGLIWYTFTDHPWVQRWDVTPDKPWTSRRTRGPYNYLFADNLPDPVPQLLGRLVSGQDWVAPAFGAAVITATRAGLTAALARDMWGPAKDFLNFVKPTTLRVSAGSHAIIVARADVQEVVHRFSEWMTAALARYRDRRQYPLNSCVEIRVTGVDDPAAVGIRGAVAPSLSAAAPVAGRPELDTVVWLDALTLPGTPHEYAFFEELEASLRTDYADLGVARPEWAKRWATTADGSWTDDDVIAETPALFPEWGSAVRTLSRYDPDRVFSSPLLDRLMPG
ncbi:cholesterol oxidase substrate-binding domain-containing protein [Mycetocola reblochoni]|uniref:FAD/FMN-containing dehydrogenases n=2 Tax=Mycetocola reblochoni TaxID=331618 RepID=A0A1R4INB0_9MICO|nr:cholesterol oxidase substrate-binding domain-containing protein [Mycetocola reblochoni]RLP67892.1 FAD-binding protein [Mycetocola reblochoni]SJN21396.1 FAD/FMN-containing dehydrogenases [Mycetocola reblochoni REB411]